MTRDRLAPVLAALATLLTTWSLAPVVDGKDWQSPCVLLILVVMVVGMVVYAISFLLIRLLSRYRELAADRSGALLTGKPSALASALQKVTGDMARIPTRDLRAAEPVNAFYFAPAFAKRGAMVTLSGLFSTHPSLERRLEELAKISRQLSQ